MIMATYLYLPMPIKTQEDILALQDVVREAVAKADTDNALATLLAAIPASRPKHNQVLLLAGRKRDIYDYEITNRLPQDQLEILRNELRHDLLLFIDRLSLIDFSEEAPPRPELKPGHLLYKVPPKMALRESYDCIVRVAHQLSQVLDGLTLDESITLEEVTVAEVMEVEVIDPSPADDRSFDILLLSDGEQLVDAYSYTEWVFNVRALKEGTQKLVLKISVLLTVDGKERTKNIVLHREVEVLATAPKEDAPLIRVAEAEVITEVLPPPVVEPMDVLPAESGGSLADDLSAKSVGGPAAPPQDRSSGAEEGVSKIDSPAPKAPPPVPILPPEKKPASRRQMLSIATTVLLLVFCGWWVIGNIDNNEIDVPNGGDTDLTTPVDRVTRSKPIAKENNDVKDIIKQEGNEVEGPKAPVVLDRVETSSRELAGKVDGVDFLLRFTSPATSEEEWPSFEGSLALSEDLLVGTKAQLLPKGFYKLTVLLSKEKEWVFIFANSRNFNQRDRSNKLIRVPATSSVSKVAPAYLDFELFNNMLHCKWKDIVVSIPVAKKAQ